MRLVATLIALLTVTTAFSQEPKLLSSASSRKDEGRFFFFWGYNRSIYSKGDIHVKGEGYDFTAEKVKADDDPEAFDPNIYFNITKLTIPQFNFRAGYFLTERTCISLGWDHLKYRTNHQQTVNVTGDYVKNGEVITYDNEPIYLTNRFFHLEHTDGLNYIRFNLDYKIPALWNKAHTVGIDLMPGVGLGPVCPWTDAVLDGKQYRTFFRPAGAAISTNLTVRANIGKSFFIQTTGRVGGVKLIDVYIDPNIRAKQQFFYGEFNITAGCTFGFKNFPRKTK